MASSRSQRVSLSHGGLDRSYLLFRPEGDRPLPLVMMLHGAGGSAEFAQVETGWSELAGREGFAVAYPEGVPVRPDRQSKFFTNPQEWHDGSGRGRHDDVGFLLAVLDHLSPFVDPQRVYLTGFSNGAGMAFRFAAEHADRLAAIAPVAGHCWVEPHPSRSLPTFYMVGDADPLVPLAGGPVRTFWGNAESRPPVEQTLRWWGDAIGHPHGSATFPVKIIPQHGHHWPGGRGLLGEKLGGPLSTETDATREIWQFFRSTMK
jgi:polyhydroxybutyrate depolymerase